MSSPGRPGPPAGSAPRPPHRRRVAWESTLAAGRNLLVHPLRTALAGLALAAAVATTALVVTALQGLEAAARAAGERAFGTETFLIGRVFPGRLGRRELADKLARNPAVTDADVRFLDRWAGGRVLYAPIAQRGGDVANGPYAYPGAAINGTTATLERLRDLTVERGRFFSDDESRRGSQVAILGIDLAETLFPGGDPLGKSFRLAGRGFLVVGVLERQGTAAGQSLDRYVWIPLTAWERLYGAPESLQVFARAAAGFDRGEAEELSRMILRARRNLAPGEADNFELLRPEASRSFVETLSGRISAAGPPLSLMALLAAIVVVTNTVLVSVSQRTREIGIRRAVGASKANVLTEVLAESFLIALAGGLCGLAAAVGVLAVAERLLGTALPLRPGTAVASLVAASLSGLAAGWYPARRAASIEVTAALRRE